MIKYNDLNSHAYLVSPAVEILTYYFGAVRSMST